MSDSAVLFLLVPGFFFSIVLFIEAGRRLGARYVSQETERARSVLGTIETAIYALFGLMVAFTFAGAASRLDVRRSLTVDEANAIGTAYLRVDLLPAATQQSLRAMFRTYTQERIAVYQSLPDLEASNAHTSRAVALQNEIWADAVTGLEERPAAAVLVLPALNDMIDITTTRSIMLNTHTPGIIVAVLSMLTVVCALFLGNGLAREKSFGISLHTIGFALVVTATMYVIFDLDHPRFGLIRLDYVDRALLDVLESMK